jgi:hypothetical protein
MPSYYLRCESDIQIIEGQISCSAWQSVSEDELLGALVRSSMLSQEDFWIVGAGVTVIMCTAIGVRVLLKLLFNSSKGNDS